MDSKGSVLTPRLPSIPVVDVREGGTLRHARESRERARGLRDACVAWFPAAARPLVPLLDGIARRWLTRSQSPYVEEVRAIAAALGFPGIWFLNGSYQWSCTALARDEDGAPWLARTLDWPFPGLGRFVELVRMQGPAGEFINVTWPGYVGVLTALAPGRFGAAINQGPMRRRSHGRALRLYDLAANAVATLRHVRAIPPDQLLRRVFEEARDYDEAKRMLETTPVARPVIYTLAGCRAGRALRDRAHRGWLQHPHRRSRRGERLAGKHAALGRPHRREQGADLLVRGGGAIQPGAPRRAGALARLVRARQLRLGRAAGAQSLHADRGRDESRRAASSAPSATSCTPARNSPGR